MAGCSANFLFFFAMKIIIRRAPVRFAASPTQPFNAVGMLKSKTTSKPYRRGDRPRSPVIFNVIKHPVIILRCGRPRRSPLHHPRQRGFDFDFKILTAFIRLGRARPAGAGCPPYTTNLRHPSSFHRYALGQIPRHIHVVPAQNRYVVR